MVENSSHFVLLIQSPDRPGIMAAISSALFAADYDIRESEVYGDPNKAKFFVRVHVASPTATAEEISILMAPIIDRFELEISIHNLSRKMPVLLAVSKFDHCLIDILHKWRIGALHIDIRGVVSNHEKLSYIAEREDLPFHHLPITKETKPQQEAAFAKVIDASGAELVVLARYMQVLSDDFSRTLSGRCINIHHSFLPSFKGAKPYHQAHKRGVKLIGATAHFVTGDLDEGPIIEQDVRRVNHKTTTEEMIEIGREVEASVLSRAIKWYATHRIILSVDRTIVFN